VGRPGDAYRRTGHQSLGGRRFAFALTMLDPVRRPRRRRCGHLRDLGDAVRASDGGIRTERHLICRGRQGREAVLAHNARPVLQAAVQRLRAAPSLPARLGHRDGQRLARHRR
jgi:hypothetical protein